MTGEYAQTLALTDDAELWRRLLTRVESANDPRRERYDRLVSEINGWPVTDALTPVLDWAAEALRTRIPA